MFINDCSSVVMLTVATAQMWLQQCTHWTISTVTVHCALVSTLHTTFFFFFLQENAIIDSHLWWECDTGEACIFNGETVCLVCTQIVVNPAVYLHVCLCSSHIL